MKTERAPEDTSPDRGANGAPVCNRLTPAALPLGTNARCGVHVHRRTPGRVGGHKPTASRRSAIRGLVTLLVLACVSVAEGGWKAGTATAIITPSEPLWMGGYAARTRPAEGTSMDLRLKVLALQDDNGARAVVVTSDLLGIPQNIYQNACAALKEQFGLEPHQVILSASHTHSGPVLRESAMDAYALDAKQRAAVEAYSSALQTSLLKTVGEALGKMEPAQLLAGEGNTRFAVNRRNNPEKQVLGLIRSGTTRGPVDHTVPVLSVLLPDGTLKALLFGYACHNTVMSLYEWSGDYAGYAQAALEKSHPGATALFFAGCAGDQNPLPRRQLFLAERYGNMLAAAVEEVLLSPMRSVSPELRTVMETVDLALGDTPSVEELRSILDDAKSNATARRWATRLLAQIQSGEQPARSYPFPIQVWQFGGKQLLITLGGEPVIDYALRFKAEFGRRTWVAGYCNDVMAYIPSLRVLKEDMSPQPGWGYEGARSMMPYGLPAFRWSERVEEQVSGGVRQLVERVRSAKPVSGE